jgi:hypothetical protein
MKEDFYRLRLSRRSNWLARIGNTPAAAKTIGWPGDVPCGILQVDQKNEFPPSAADVMEFRPRADPQPSFTPHVRPRLQMRRRPAPCNFQGRSDKRGCEGRLRSRSCAKLLGIHRRRRELRISFRRRMPRRTSTGQPAGFAATQKFPIRASRLDRHGNRNR